MKKYIIAIAAIVALLPISISAQRGRAGARASKIGGPKAGAIAKTPRQEAFAKRGLAARKEQEGKGKTQIIAEREAAVKAYRAERTPRPEVIKARTTSSAGIKTLAKQIRKIKTTKPRLSGPAKAPAQLAPPAAPRPAPAIPTPPPAPPVIKIDGKPLVIAPRKEPLPVAPRITKPTAAELQKVQLKKVVQPAEQQKKATGLQALFEKALGRAGKLPAAKEPKPEKAAKPTPISVPVVTPPVVTAPVAPTPVAPKPAAKPETAAEKQAREKEELERGALLLRALTKRRAAVADE